MILYVNDLVLPDGIEPSSQGLQPCARPTQLQEHKCRLLFHRTVADTQMVMGFLFGGEGGMSNVIRVAGNLDTTLGRVPSCKSGHFSSCAGTWFNRETLSL